MLKDPNHKNQTPYEILGIPFNASLAQVKKALIVFLQVKERKQPQLIKAAQQANKALQNPKARAQIDVWLYDAVLPQQSEAPTNSLDLTEFGQPTIFKATELFCDLSGNMPEEDVDEIVLHEASFVEVTEFDDKMNATLLPDFDH